MSDKIKRRIFSKFCDFINDYTKENDDNPSLEVIKTSDESYKYLILRLKNVSKANSRFYKDIEAYTPGTKMEMDDVIDGTGKIFTVMVPLKSAQKRHSRDDEDNDEDYDEDEKPDATSIFALLVLLSGILTFASFTTDYNDWLNFFKM